MSKSIELTINGKAFKATLNSNQTVDDLLNMLPLELSLQRYAAHEYYGKLPQKPSVRGVPMTSMAHAGGIYYYDGWTAFTVLYGDASIAPYEVVHIGDVEPGVIDFLQKSGILVNAKIKFTD